MRGCWTYKLEMIMADLRGRYPPRWGRMAMKQKSFKVREMGEEEESTNTGRKGGW